MSRIRTSHNPDLVPSRIADLLRSHLPLAGVQTYDVRESRGRVIVKKGRASVRIQVLQSDDSTELTLCWILPPWALLVGIVALILGAIFAIPLIFAGWLMLRRGGKALEEELASITIERGRPTLSESLPIQLGTRPSTYTSPERQLLSDLRRLKVISSWVAGPKPDGA